MMRLPLSCVSMTIRAISASRPRDVRVQRDGGLDGGLRVELGGERNLEEDVLHHVRAEPLRGTCTGFPRNSTS